ncbi:hypothetical protein RRG08_008049 [Elysia crispata]|uniref:Uncharacterized protein n=1 Tax=Elysia crispata TaxID=231223 RepID=A0AAE1AHZ9_9GAST|nr:hypothetical protein RRG08_008049 [Elysia crispata]
MFMRLCRRAEERDNRSTETETRFFKDSSDSWSSRVPEINPACRCLYCIAGRKSPTDFIDQLSLIFNPDQGQLHNVGRGRYRLWWEDNSGLELDRNRIKQARAGRGDSLRHYIRRATSPNKEKPHGRLMLQ